MKILIVSGFLGAGKTTFIKELIRRSGKQPVILENEYGETDLDARAIEGASEASKDLKILEFMEGCVCCTKKDTFANTILAISASLDPEYLVVEPSGVGKLSSILETANKVTYEKIEILPSILILTPRSMRMHLQAYPEIYEDQIRNAGRIVFSKIEQEDPAVIEDTVKRLRSLNDRAEIITRPYPEQEDDWWASILPENRYGTIAKGSVNSPDNTENDPAALAAQMDQLTLREGRLSSPGELIVFLEDILHGAFGIIPRAKGEIPVGNAFLRFDVADGLYLIGEAEETEESPKTQCVFIGSFLDEKKIRERLQAKKVLKILKKPVS